MEGRGGAVRGRAAGAGRSAVFIHSCMRMDAELVFFKACAEGTVLRGAPSPVHGEHCHQRSDHVDHADDDVGQERLLLAAAHGLEQLQEDSMG